MGINVSQFSPPGTVSKLVWDDDMQAAPGKIFKGDLTGDVTGDVTGNVTGNLAGNAYGFIVRNFAYSASSNDVLIIPAGSNTSLNWSKSNAPIFNSTVILGNATNTGVIKLGALGSWSGDDNDTEIYGNCTITCYDSAGTQLYHYTHSGGASMWSYYDATIPQNTSRIVITGSGQWSWDDVYAVIDTTVIPGMIPQPTTGVFTGNVVGNVTGNVTGNVSGDVTGDLTGNVTGKIILNGCTWRNGEYTWPVARETGHVSLIGKASVVSNTTTPVVSNRYISYPYLGCIDFQPKPASPALTFTVVLSGPVQSASIGGQLDVLASNNVAVLRTYRKDNAIGTFTFPVDLTDAYRLVITSQGDASSTVTSSIDSLFVQLPYYGGLVD